MTATEPARTDAGSTGVRRVTERSEVPRVAATLADAFEADPVICHLVAPGRRRRALGVMFGRLVADYLEVGEVHVAGDGRAATLWAPPHGFPIGGWTGLRQLPMALRVFGRRPLRSLRTEIRVVSGLPKQPYWYLDVIGVEAAAHGRGLGSELLAAKNAELDAAGEPAHLTASSERSRDLYKRHGYEVFGEIALPDDGPTLWRMWREPR